MVFILFSCLFSSAVRDSFPFKFYCVSKADSKFSFSLSIATGIVQRSGGTKHKHNLAPLWGVRKQWGYSSKFWIGVYHSLPATPVIVLLGPRNTEPIPQRNICLNPFVRQGIVISFTDHLGFPLQLMRAFPKSFFHTLRPIINNYQIQVNTVVICLDKIEKIVFSILFKNSGTSPHGHLQQLVSL